MDSVARIVMLGPAPEARRGMVTVVDTCRAHGLFRRWPIEYVATRGPGGMCRISVALQGAAQTGLNLGRGRALFHIHACADAEFWVDAGYVAAARALRCPVLLQLHGGEFERLYSDETSPGARLVRRTLERATCVAVASRRLLAWVRSVAPHARAAWLPAPVAVPMADGSARPNLVLFLGRLELEKGTRELLSAMAQVRAAVPDVRLVLAGEGARAPLVRTAERLGIADAVKFVGPVGPSGKRALFSSAAAFALPSYSEDLPMSLLEAMAAGVPVIAPSIGAIPEVVVDGVTGFFCAPGDGATLARLLRKLLLERALGEKVGAAARESVRLRFSPERALPALEGLYAELGVRPLVPAGAGAGEGGVA